MFGQQSFFVDQKKITIKKELNRLKIGMEIN